ncbi:MAG: hypothetical protein ACLFR1_09580 [Spirochaetia bacterium]
MEEESFAAVLISIVQLIILWAYLAVKKTLSNTEESHGLTKIGIFSWILIIIVSLCMVGSIGVLPYALKTAGPLIQEAALSQTQLIIAMIARAL